MIRSLLASMMIGLAFASSVLAQAAAPAADKPAEADKPWLTGVVAVILLGFVLAANLKKSKRDLRQ